jgi:hypothetical protein
MRGGKDVLGGWVSVGIGGALLQDSNPPVEIDVCEPDQAGQIIVGAHDLLPQDGFDAIDSGVALCEQLDLRAKPFRDDVEVSAGLEGRRIDILPQIAEAQIDLVEAPVNVVQSMVDVLAQAVERCLQLGIHGVILLQSKEAR